MGIRKHIALAGMLTLTSCATVTPRAYENHQEMISTVDICMEKEKITKEDGYMPPITFTPEDGEYSRLTMWQEYALRLQVPPITATEYKKFILDRLTGYLQDLTPKMRRSIQSITINPSGLTYLVGCGTMTGGCVRGGKMTIGEYIDKPLFVHETAHTYHNAVRQEGYKHRAKSEWINERWKAVAGDVYNKHTTLKIVGMKNGTMWDSFPLFGPRYGCIGPYGCNNINEDVATFTETAITDPEQMSTLVQSTDERYRKKVDLLYEYDFLTSAQYKAIVCD